MLIRGDDNWRMTLNLPVALTELPKINLQKIFKLLFQNEWLNRETIANLDAAFPEISDDLKARWSKAAKREYEHFQTRIALWSELKDKYHISII